MIKLYDITIGDFPVSQYFGANPTSYSWIKDIDKNPIKGHNGLDVKTPSGVILINPFPKENDVVVSYAGTDTSGYGNYIRIWDKTQQCVVLYAHCQRTLVQKGDKLVFQQAVAESDNTGWSTGPHLHFALYKVDANGNRLNRQNGYDGYLNPVDKNIVEWTILNPTAPASPDPSQVYIQVKAADHTRLVTNSDNFQRVIDYLKLGKHANDTSSDEVIRSIQGIEDRIPKAQPPKKEEPPKEEPKPEPEVPQPSGPQDSNTKLVDTKLVKEDLERFFEALRRLLVIKW